MTTKPFTSIGIGNEVFHLVGFGTDGKIAFPRKTKRLTLLRACKLLPPSDRRHGGLPQHALCQPCSAPTRPSARHHPCDLCEAVRERTKNDHDDAEAIAEAALRPSLRVVREKIRDQPDLQALHRVRSHLLAANGHHQSDP